MQNIIIKHLTAADIYPEMLKNFKHEQYISSKWVNKNGKWDLTEASDVRQWSDEKRIWITKYMRQQLERGGAVLGAFQKDKIVGFCCVDGVLCGESAKYANLTMLFVDDNCKRQGIGKGLFHVICQSSVKIGADKLFISAIPSRDTVEFYFKMGCVDAEEVIGEFVDTEWDRYLERKLDDVV